MEKKVVVKNINNVKNLLVQVNLEIGKLMVFSGFSVWENIRGRWNDGSQCVKILDDQGLKNYQIVRIIHVKGWR